MMKKHLLILSLLAFLPLYVQSQATTNNIHASGVEDFQVTEDWAVHVEWNTVGNYRYVYGQKADLETRYTLHYRAKWIYTNLKTGEVVTSPTVEHITGVYTFNASTGPSFDDHEIEHWIKDPVYQSYHLVQKVIVQYNPDTGYVEMVDIKNEWIK